MPPLPSSFLTSCLPLVSHLPGADQDHLLSCAHCAGDAQRRGGGPDHLLRSRLGRRGSGRRSKDASQRIVPVCNLGPNCLALNSIWCSPGNKAKSAQGSGTFFPSMCMTMIESPVSTAHPVAHDPDLLLG